MVFDSYIHLSPSTPFHRSRLPHPAGQLSSCRRGVTVTSVASHSGMTLFFLGMAGFWRQKMGGENLQVNPGISIWHLLVEFWNAKHSSLSIRYIYIYRRIICIERSCMVSFDQSYPSTIRFEQNLAFQSIHTTLHHSNYPKRNPRHDNIGSSICLYPIISRSAL